MTHTNVSSSDLRSVGYENRTLEIRFHSGGVYRYYDVPQSVYINLMQASSHGKYFHRYIKNYYRYSRVA